MLKKALGLLWLTYGNDSTIDGKPYVFDAILTALEMHDDTDKVVALLMNVLEKPTVKIEDLERQKFPGEVISAIVALTRNEDESFGSYLERVGGNVCARRVKIAELRSKIKELQDGYSTENNDLKIERYGYAIEFLEHCEKDSLPTDDEWL